MKKLTSDFGKAPWSEEEIKRSVQQFNQLYKNRFIKKNIGGMRAPHMFASWFIAKYLQPNYIIESGIWKGGGTWILEKASPKSKLICIDPNLKKDRYVSKNAIYSKKDFNIFNWDTIPQKENALIIFDDHQNALKRVRLAKKYGFKHIIFDDNYPPVNYGKNGFGDFYSIKRVLEKRGFSPNLSIKTKLLKLAWTIYYTKNIKLIYQAIKDFKKISPNKKDATDIHKMVDVYYEFPPIFKPNFPNKKFGKFFKKKPILNKSFKNQFPEIYSEKDFYGGICYLKLKS